MGKLTVAIMLLLTVMGVKAEDKSIWTIEYLPTDDYKNVIGFGLYNIKEESYGYYGNIHVSITSNEPHYDYLNIKSFGDSVTGRYEELLIFDFGVTKKITHLLMAI